LCVEVIDIVLLVTESSAYLNVLPFGTCLADRPLDVTSGVKKIDFAIALSLSKEGHIAYELIARQRDPATKSGVADPLPDSPHA